MFDLTAINSIIFFQASTFISLQFIILLIFCLLNYLSFIKKDFTFAVKFRYPI